MSERYIQPSLDGGIPVLGTDVISTESEIYNILIALCKGQMSTRSTAGTSGNEASLPGVRFTDNNDDGMIISGVYADTTDFKYVDFSQTGTFSISSGYVYLDDEVCFYPGETLSEIAANSGLFLVKDTETFKSRLFFDGNTKNVRTTINAKIVENLLSSPPTGPYVLLTSATNGGTPYYNSQDISYAARLDTDIFNNTLAISNLGQTITNNQAKETTNLSITTGADWNIISPHTITLTRYPNSGGRVDMEAVISHTTGVSSTVCTIPSGWRPSSFNGSNVSHIVHTNDPAANTGYIKISSTGLVTAGIGSGYTMTIKTFWFS